MATTQTTDPDIAARRARVAAMRGTMSNRSIAARLGVAESTVRRDIAALDAARATLDAERATLDTARATTRASTPQRPTTQHATTQAPAAPLERRITLTVDDRLADALRVLVDYAPGARHTSAAYRTAAHAAILTMADTIRHRARHAAAQGAPSLATAAPSGRAAAPRAQLAS